MSSGKDFAVRGSGTAVCAVDMSAFVRDAVLEGGCTFSVEAASCFGVSTEKGAVTVRDGAAICLNLEGGEQVLKNKKVYFEGTGPDGDGAFRVVANVAWNALWNNEFYLTGDAKIKLMRSERWGFLSTDYTD